MQYNVDDQSISWGPLAYIYNIIAGHPKLMGIFDYFRLLLINAGFSLVFLSPTETDHNPGTGIYLIGPKGVTATIYQLGCTTTSYPPLLAGSPRAYISSGNEKNPFQIQTIPSLFPIQLIELFSPFAFY